MTKGRWLSTVGGVAATWSLGVGLSLLALSVLAVLDLRHLKDSQQPASIGFAILTVILLVAAAPVGLAHTAAGLAYFRWRRAGPLVLGILCAFDAALPLSMGGFNFLHAALFDDPAAYVTQLFSSAGSVPFLTAALLFSLIHAVFACALFRRAMYEFAAVPHLPPGLKPWPGDPPPLAATESPSTDPARSP